jgi:N-acetylglucosamine-6-phosphate deacetylase
MDEVRIEGIDYLSNKPIQVCIENGKISHIALLPSKTKPTHLPYIGPGLIDIQVNGFFGIDFNSTGLFAPEIKTVVLSLLKEGVTTFYPTLVTNSPAAIEQEIANIINACQTYPELNNFIGGIHLEGPFISKEPETCGAHNPKYICKPNWGLIEKWQETAEGKIKIITLSPEWPGANEFIQKCTRNGILVSIGHTSASPQQILSAVEAGAVLSTHLGNGSHLNIPRENNYFWEQLSNDNLWASIITDGFHLTDSIIKVMLRAKPDKVVLISDSTKFSKLMPGTYNSIIGDTVVLDKNGRLYIENEPRLLAGSAQSILFGVNNLINKKITSLQQAWEMASLKPAKLLGLKSYKGLIEGAPADIVLFKHEQNELQVIQTIKNGKKVYSAKQIYH